VGEEGNSDANYCTTLDQREDVMGLGDQPSGRGAQSRRSQPRHHMIPSRGEAPASLTSQVSRRS